MSDATNPAGSGSESAAPETGAIIRETVAEMPENHDAGTDNDDEQPVSLDDPAEPSDDPDEGDEGGSSDDDTETAPEATEPERYTVRIDGKDVEVTPAELKEWRDSGLRHADYTRKTQEAADIRRQAEAKQAEYQQALETVVGQLQQDPLLNRKAEDWAALKDSDPIQYAVEWADAQQKYQAMQQHHARLQQEKRSNYNKFVEREKAQLLRIMPDLADEQKYREVAETVAKYATANGYAPQELEYLMAHHMRDIHKAAKYDALMAKREEVAKKVSKAPPVQKPGGTAGKPGAGVDPSKMTMAQYAKWRGYAK